MCIRDRLKTAYRPEIASLAGFSESHVRNLLKQLQAENLIAVSYTHLRAHETVLDIVCRLLLEKKKQT